VYCPKCGAQNPENSSFCSQCGATMTQPASVPPPTVATVRNSGLAIASLVLGIIGFIFNFLSILAIIFGAVAMNQTSKNPNLKGRGMAVTGLVLGIIVAVLWTIILVWAATAFLWF
jgi:uncharacterized membrane protein YvbJ